VPGQYSYRSGGRGVPEPGQAAPARAASERVVDPYGLVCKAGIWYLVADSGGEPRLFRVSRMMSAAVHEAPVRRRDGVELAGLWELLRRGVEDRPAPVMVRVRRDWLDLFSRICAAHLDGPVDGALDGAGSMHGEWAGLRLRFAGVAAARILLSFGGNVEVTSPPEVRADLAKVAAEVVDQYSQPGLTGVLPS
jgi:predicted DNA-binding transcriptional regulator YafY